MKKYVLPITCIFIALSLIWTSCEDFYTNDNQSDTTELEIDSSIRLSELNELLLDNGLNFGQLKKYVDAQKVYFVYNDSVHKIYEITLDYKDAFKKGELTPANVYLKAEEFYTIDFNAHIAATLDGEHLIVVENGGQKMLSIELKNKKETEITKPSTSLTQVGFDMDGNLFAAGGLKFYQLKDWETGICTFEKLNYDGLPKISGGDLLFLNYPDKPNSFLSFSRSNNQNDGDGAYFIDIIENDRNMDHLISYIKLFEIRKNVTGACVIGPNILVSTHQNYDSAVFYTPMGEELIKLPIKTGQGDAFIAGNGDLASVNLFDGDFFNDHIKEGIIYLASNEEGKFYEIDLKNGNHKKIRDYGHKVDIHMGIIGDTMYYSYKYDTIKQVRCWNLKTGEDSLLVNGINGEKVEIYKDKVMVMSGNNLKIINRYTGVIENKKSISGIGGGGDLLISEDEKNIIVFDRNKKKIHLVDINSLEITKSVDSPVGEINGSAYNKDGTMIVSALGKLYILDKNYTVIGQKLLGFVQNNGDMASTY